MNRIIFAIKRLESRLESLSEEQIKKCETVIDNVSFEEFNLYQDTQALAHANGLISYEEAQTLYNIFGGSFPDPDKFKKLPLSEKIISVQFVTGLCKAMSKTYKKSTK